MKKIFGRINRLINQEKFTSQLTNQSRVERGFTSRFAKQSLAQQGFTFFPRKNAVPKLQQGFTLVELLVVIAIIGILVTMVIIAINPVRVVQNSQDARRRSDLQAMRTSLQLFYGDYKYYPASSTTGQLQCYTTGGKGNTATGGAFKNFNGTDSWSSDGATSCGGASDTSYIKALPKDPVNDAAHKYYYQAYDGAASGGNHPFQSYRLMANIVNSNSDDNNAYTKCGSFDTGSNRSADLNLSAPAAVNFAVCSD